MIKLWKKVRQLFKKQKNDDGLCLAPGESIEIPTSLLDDKEWELVETRRERTATGGLVEYTLRTKDTQ